MRGRSRPGQNHEVSSQTPEGDFRGESCYLRIRREGIPEALLAPYWSPIRQALDRWECRVGLGYSRFVAEALGVRVECRAFVPPGKAFLAREYSVTNLIEESVEADLVPVAEISHFDALKQLTNADWVPQTMRSRARDDGRGGKYLVAGAYMRESDFISYYATDVPASSWACERRDFLGPAGSWAAPASLTVPELPSRDAERGDPVMAFLIRLGSLPGGQSAGAVLSLGFARGLEAAEGEARRPFGPREVQQAFESLTEDWDRYLSVLRVGTPDRSIDSIVNIHAPRQTRVTTQWSRYLSRYQLGYGSDRGIGVRDTAQDLAATVAADPDLSKTLLRSLLSVQRPDGSAFHQFNPLTGRASEGDSLEYPDRYHWYSDDHLWIVLAATEYIKETGDSGFLDERLPYYPSDSGEAVPSGITWNALSSLRKATRDGTAFPSRFRGLDRPFNLPVGAESVFTACLYGKALREHAALMVAWAADPPHTPGSEADRRIRESRRS